MYIYFCLLIKKSAKSAQEVLFSTAGGIYNDQLEGMSLKKIIEEHGGKNSSSISKNTTFVIAGKNMGPSKKNKAKDLSIKILTEEEFLLKII